MKKKTTNLIMVLLLLPFTTAVYGVSLEIKISFKSAVELESFGHFFEERLEEMAVSQDTKLEPGSLVNPLQFESQSQILIEEAVSSMSIIVPDVSTN